MDFLVRVAVSSVLALPVVASAQERPATASPAAAAESQEITALRARLEALEKAQAQDHEQLEHEKESMKPVAPQVIPQGPASAPVDTARAGATPAQGPAAKASDVQVDWGAGAPVFRSADGVFSFKPRGRVLTDISGTRGSLYAPRNLTTTGARGLRLGAEGGVGAHLFYQFETDFADDKVGVVTAYIGWRHQVLGLDYDLQLGNLFNDRGVEGGTGTDATPFLERSVVATAVIPQRGFYGMGAMARLFGKGWHVSLTATGDDIHTGYAASDSRTFLGRAHWNPVKTDFLTIHLGLSGFNEQLSGAATTVTRNTGIGGRFDDNLRVSSGALTGATGGTGYEAELGGFVGPLWIMAEAGERRVQLTGASDFITDALSTSAGFFVTGETPPYNPRFGTFTQPKVRRPVIDGGPGAIEITARYENLGFYGVPVGGRGHAATVGVNWYLNSFMRLMFNGILWHTDNRAGDFTGRDDGHTLSVRGQVSF